jgi:outer membrane protein TolC
MSVTRGRKRMALLFLLVLSAGLAGQGSAGQEARPPLSAPVALPGPLAALPGPLAAPAPAACDRPLPINLPTALKLAGARPLDIALATQRLEVALAALDRARALWLPGVTFGTDYSRHDGRVQDVAGNVFDTSRGSFMLGAGSGIGANAIISVNDALFGPLAARQVLRAREAEVQVARNDALLATAEAYFNVQQARGELAAAQDVADRAAELVRRTEELVRRTKLVAQLEVVRARAQAAHSRQVIQSARERWRASSAELNRVLRLAPGTLAEPLEPPHLRVNLVAPEQDLDELTVLGLRNRPELASRQALVEATLQQWRAERWRPLVPSVLVRGASTPVTGTLAGGFFGGGLNSSLNHFGARLDVDVQVLWELQNLGFGNRALVKQRRAENELARLDLLRTQDLVVSEVHQAFAQLRSAADRLGDAEAGLRDAEESARLNAEGMRETTLAGGVLVLVVRPQEAVAAVQALGQAYADYYGAVADFNRAQFRLYRALGEPAQGLTCKGQESGVRGQGSGVRKEGTGVDGSLPLSHVLHPPTPDP